MLSSLLSSLLFVGCLVAVARSTCNVCNSVNKMACSSMTKSRACDANNLPTGEEYDCPPGYMCVSGSGGVVCQPKTSLGHVAACEDCNKCDASRTFACTGSNSFALCLGSNKPQESKGTCSSGYVCSIESSQICELATSVNPSCSYVATTTTTTTTTTTRIPPTDTPQETLNTVCRRHSDYGAFAIGNDLETTCRQYVMCYWRYGDWYGTLEKCPANTYFNAVTRVCDRTIPARCYPPTVPTTSTSTTTSTTTTAAPSTNDPAAYCAKVQQQSYFPVGTNPSTTCRQYIKCFQVNNKWSGQRYTCAGSLYFNSATKTCVSTLPATCSSGIKSISINGVDLDLD